jgi:hypothetical protein
VIFPAESLKSEAAHPRAAGEWWLVVLALVVAAAMIAIAFAVR